MAEAWPGSCATLPLHHADQGLKTDRSWLKILFASFPLDSDLSCGNSEFSKNQATMAQIERLQLETDFESLVRQAVSH